MPDIDSKQAMSILEKRLRKDRKRFTLNEAAAATGLSIDAARDAFETLIKKYVCRLQVTENGDLIYDFGASLRRWDEKTPAERLAAAGVWSWKIFTIIYKAWITVTLVVYFVLFVVILIALVVITSSGRDRRRSRGPSVDLGRFAYMFFSIFRWRTITGTTMYRTDQLGYRYRKYHPTPGALDEKKKNLVASVYDFVFGPPRVKIDPLNNQKEVAAYLLQQKGIVVSAELCALAGWTFSKAETFFTDCLVRFAGEVKVSENGVVYGQFDEVMRGLGQLETAEIIYYWDEYEPEYELTGNSQGHNLLIAFMNGFNLLFAYLVLSGSLANIFYTNYTYDLSSMLQPFLQSLSTPGSAANVLLGWIPLVFSISFFLIPAVRWLLLQKARKQRTINNIRKRLYKVIFQKKGRAQTSDAVVHAINDKAQEDQLPRETVENMLNKLALDMPGDTLVTDAGELLYVFPRVTYEMEEVDELRKHRKLDGGLGKVIVDSEG